MPPQGPKTKAPFPIENQTGKETINASELTQIGHEPCLNDRLHGKVEVWKSAGRDAGGEYQTRHIHILEGQFKDQRIDEVARLKLVAVGQGQSEERFLPSNVSLRNADGSLRHLSEYEYDKQGNLAQARDRAYDGKGRMTKLCTATYSNGEMTTRESTHFDSAGKPQDHYKEQRQPDRSWQQITEKQGVVRSNAALEKVADVAHHVAHTAGHARHQDKGDMQKAA